MTDKNDDFWKELMGEDFKVDLPLDTSPEPPAPASPPPEESAPEPPPRKGAQAEEDAEPFLETPKKDMGFTIEYVSREGGEVPPAKEPESAPEVPKEDPQDPWETFLKKSSSVPPAERRTSPKPQETPERRTSPKPQETPERRTSPKPQEPPERRQSPRPQEPPERRTNPRPQQAAGGKRRRDKDNFEVEFDFDAAYQDVDEKAVRRGRSRRTGCLSGILLFLFVICVSVVLAVMGWTWATDVLGLDGEDQVVEVTLPRSVFHTEEREQEDEEGNVTLVTVNVADMDQVAEELYQKGLIRYRWLFKLFSRFAHGDTKVQAGTYNLNMNYDYRALINGMNPRSGKRNTVKLTIPEGYTITQIVALMEENKVCSSEDLLKSLKDTDFDYDFLDKSTLGDPKRLEGYLFPDTYEFYENDDPDSVIKRFLNNFQKKWEDEFDEKAKALGYSQREILIVASMIEKEAGGDTERDTIASVIYNRLGNPDKQGTNGRLQIDATINYVTADTGEKFSTDLDSPYNTYLYPGLPPGPIANPGLASIRAALDPAETKYYFYALGKNGLHRFFNDYDDFTAFVHSDEFGG